MVDSALFDALEYIARNVRKTTKPFGGIQLLLCGDYFQLPPVKGAGFTFESNSWKTCNIRTFELTTVERQKDPLFVGHLHMCRKGIFTDEFTNLLRKTHVSRKALPTDGISPTKVYCVNRDVDKENSERLALLPGNLHTFNAKDKIKPGSNRDRISDLMEKKSASVINLKVGAQVILTRNYPQYGLVNGSRGVVYSFNSDSDTGKAFPTVNFDNGVTRTIRWECTEMMSPDGKIKRIQLPLKLAWALTVHKTQGMTLTRVELVLSNAFEEGQVYVALSRVASLEGLWLSGPDITQKMVRANQLVANFYFTSTCTDSAAATSTTRQLPADTPNGRPSFFDHSVPSSQRTTIDLDVYEISDSSDNGPAEFSLQEYVGGKRTTETTDTRNMDKQIEATKTDIDMYETNRDSEIAFSDLVENKTTDAPNKRIEMMTSAIDLDIYEISDSREEEENAEVVTSESTEKKILSPATFLPKQTFSRLQYQPSTSNISSTQQHTMTQQHAFSRPRFPTPSPISNVSPTRQTFVRLNSRACPNISTQVPESQSSPLASNILPTQQRLESSPTSDISPSRQQTFSRLKQAPSVPSNVPDQQTFTRLNSQPSTISNTQQTFPVSRVMIPLHKRLAQRASSSAGPTQPFQNK
eukprot:TRINITY_DN6980_c0_g1_i3.p1 TRINITY_DN6980_c0_g1~~TRINITY_DN6980_c0_g1_i3.p1  ORF type:complete len:639 (+),score=58.66 TRINITY_DN6980_c0_g1_i3:684-2600(+)